MMVSGLFSGYMYNVCLSFFQTLCLVGIAVSTFLFTLVWQFAQFILLLESMAFFGTYSLGFIPKYKVRSETGKTKLLEQTFIGTLSQPWTKLIDTNWKLRLLQTFAGVLQSMIHTGSNCKETPTNYISIKRL